MDHMLNRGNRREPFFHRTEDFEAFERIMVEAIERSHIKLYVYCLMPNHWHRVVSPEVDGEMGRFGQWLDLTPTQRHHAQSHTAGDGEAEPFAPPRPLTTASPEHVRQLGDVGVRTTSNDRLDF